MYGCLGPVGTYGESLCECDCGRIWFLLRIQKRQPFSHYQHVEQLTWISACRLVHQFLESMQIDYIIRAALNEAEVNMYLGDHLVLWYDLYHTHQTMSNCGDPSLRNYKIRAPKISSLYCVKCPQTWLTEIGINHSPRAVIMPY